MIIVTTSNKNFAAALSCFKEMDISQPQPRHFVQGITELQKKFMEHGRPPNEPGSDEEFDYIVLKLPKELQVPKPKIRS